MEPDGSDRKPVTSRELDLELAWKKGQFLIGGYQGRRDPYFVAQAGGEPVRVAAGEKDDKPTDWWLP